MKKLDTKTTVMKRTAQRFTGLVLSALILAMSCVMPASAASSVSGSLDGTVVTGSISTTSTSASAKTTFSRSGVTINAKATVYYWWGSRYYYTAVSSTAQAGGVSATATKKLGGAEVVGGIGEHSVSFDGYSWNKTTSTGTIPSSATKK
ncbi:MAG: hypothetical protein LUD84_10035 [Clostridiales bacterium]|nr:hypothetical protein [Clostridiales bacterium]